MSKSFPNIKFQKAQPGEFFDVLKKRVDDYFSLNGLARQANFLMHVKIFVCFIFYLTLFGFIYSNQFTGITLILLYSLLGFAISLVCFNFCHDLLHGAYFKSQKLNYIIGFLYDINGFSSYMWRITHNLRHHSYTNIQGHDEDIDKAILLRLAPKDKLYSFHKYQRIYAFFLYLFTSLNWAYYSDGKGLYKEATKSVISTLDILFFIFFKVFNLILFLLLPLILLSAAWWQVVIGFICMHFVGGFFSAIIFQLGHVVENVTYPEADPQGIIHNRWAVHEMQTTSNFASGSQFWTGLVGGLNHQIEHHLFPQVCHIHYPNIHQIVKVTAEEFNIPYNNQHSAFTAIKSHYYTLSYLGSHELSD